MTKKNVGLLFDQTGSMEPNKVQSVDGVAEYINTLKKNDGDIRFTQVWFNSDNPFQVIHDGVKMEKVEPPTLEEYKPASTTPLYDAMGGIIKHMERSAKKKARVAIVVMTDGLENASREYTQKQIFDLVEEKKKDGWAFAFLGADIDSFAVGGAMGVARASTLNYAKAKTQEAMGIAAAAVASFMVGETDADKLFEDVEDSTAVWKK